SPRNKSSLHGSAAFHGGVFRITTAAFFVSRKRVFMYEPTSPWSLFIIYQLMHHRGRPPIAAMEDGATVRIHLSVILPPS
ncbi:MAG: hypothetical protein ACLQDI_07925, partial [Syntrophobacteraceae bacterium]